MSTAACTCRETQLTGAAYFGRKAMKLQINSCHSWVNVAVGAGLPYNTVPVGPQNYNACGIHAHTVT